MYSSQQQVNSKTMQILEEQEYKSKSGLNRVIAENGGTTSFVSRLLNNVQSGAKFKIPDGVDFIDLVTFVPALTKLILFETLVDTLYDNRKFSIKATFTDKTVMTIGKATLLQDYLTST